MNTELLQVRFKSVTYHTAILIFFNLTFSLFHLVHSLGGKKSINKKAFQLNANHPLIKIKYFLGAGPCTFSSSLRWNGGAATSTEEELGPYKGFWALYGKRP